MPAFSLAYTANIKISESYGNNETSDNDKQYEISHYGNTICGLSSIIPFVYLMIAILGPKILLAPFDIAELVEANTIEDYEFVLVAYAIIGLIDNIRQVLLANSRGVADLIKPSLISMASVWLIGMPIALSLLEYDGVQGATIGLGIGLFTNVILMAYRWCNLQSDPFNEEMKRIDLQWIKQRLNDCVSIFKFKKTNNKLDNDNSNEQLLLN